MWLRGQHLRSSALRETLYRASVTRASSGALDNGPVIAKVEEELECVAILLPRRSRGWRLDRTEAAAQLGRERKRTCVWLAI